MDTPMKKNGTDLLYKAIYMCIHYYPGTGHPVDKKLQLLYDPALHYIYIIYILCERLASGLAWLGLWGRLESYSCQSCGQASYV